MWFSRQSIFFFYNFLSDKPTYSAGRLSFYAIYSSLPPSTIWNFVTSRNNVTFALSFVSLQPYSHWYLKGQRVKQYNILWAGRNTKFTQQPESNCSDIMNCIYDDTAGLITILYIFFFHSSGHGWIFFHYIIPLYQTYIPILW